MYETKEDSGRGVRGKIIINSLVTVALPSPLQMETTYNWMSDNGGPELQMLYDGVGRRGARTVR